MPLPIMAYDNMINGRGSKRVCTIAGAALGMLQEDAIGRSTQTFPTHLLVNWSLYNQSAPIGWLQSAIGWNFRSAPSAGGGDRPIGCGRPNCRLLAGRSAVADTKKSSSQTCSRRHPVQNGPIGIFTALTGTIFVCRGATFKHFLGKIRATSGQLSGNFRAMLRQHSGNFRTTFGQLSDNFCATFVASVTADMSNGQKH